jgi:folate-dependent phosphoribosylglycinamide formyltransferase PurN
MEREEFDHLLDLALREADVQIVALAGYMRLLSADFIRKWEGRIVNIHPSLLPAYKGLDTHRRALEAGEIWVGCSVHLVTQARVRVRERESAEQLAERVLKEEHRLYPETLDAFAARLLPRREIVQGSRDL